MKIEKLNDYQIKFMLSNQDLKDRNITFNDLLQRSDKLQGLVREIMKKASETIDFNVSESPVMVEALPHKEGIALIVSKTPEKGESLERRRQLTSLYNEFIEKRLFDRTSDNIFDIVDEPNQSEKYQDSNVQSDIVFTFATLSDVINACNICAPDYSFGSTLYKMNDVYFLVLKCNYRQLPPAVRNCMLEYGESYPVQNGRIGMLAEYGKIIIEDSAVQALAECK